MKHSLLTRAAALATACSLLLGGCGATVRQPQSTPAATEASAAAEPEATAENAAAPAQDKDIVVLYTNDVHCAVDDNIGYAGLAAYKKQMERDAYVALVDAGDAVQGQAIGTLSKGEYLIDIMNQVGYDVATPGNHEFDYGMERLFQLTKMANFPYVSCNFTDLKTDKLVFKPYTILTYGTNKLAFVGISTPNSLTSSTPAYFQDGNGNFIYGFDQDETGEKLFAAVQSAVDAARAEGADYVFGLAHLGIIEAFAPYTSGDVIANTTGLDAVLDGHSHSVIECERVKNKDGQWTLLTSTGTGFQNIGMLLITKEGNMTTGLIPAVADKDADTQTYVDSLKAKLEGTLKQVVAATKTALVINDPATGERLVRRTESNLGDLVADAYRKAGNAQIALVNGGGLRADIPAGDITYKGLLTAQPFNNLLSVIEATGQQIKDALEMGARAWPEETGGFMQVSGLSYTIDTTKPSTVARDKEGMFLSVDGDYRVQDIMVDGEPLDLAKTYTVAGLTYTLINQGDGLTMFNGDKQLQTDFLLDSQAVIDYILNDLGGTVGEAYADPYGQGRITELS